MDDDRRRPNLYVPGYTAADLEEARSGATQDPLVTAAFAKERLQHFWSLIFDICERHDRIGADLITADPANLPREVQFAQVMRYELRRAEKALASGDAADALNTGFRLAQAAFQWQAEFPLGADIWRGRAIRAAGREGGAGGARAKKAAASAKRKAWQTIADEILSRHPGWSLNAVAVEVAKRDGGNPRPKRSPTRWSMRPVG